MTDRIIDLLLERGISLASPIPLEACLILRPYKLERCGFSPDSTLTAYMFAVPYFAEYPKGNLSAYAVPRDYHGYFTALFAELIPILQKEYEGYRFFGFADNSPIDERDAAAKAGLGILGDNGLLITKKYSSYVFLGEIITDLPCADAKTFSVVKCEGCGACKKNCPASNGVCLSALTQKKGAFTKDEEDIIRNCGTIWGCDICQEVCPHTKRALREGTIYTDIDYFKCDLISALTVERLQKMSSEEFDLRAYSWRGRETVERNLQLLKKTSGSPLDDNNNLEGK